VALGMSWIMPGVAAISAGRHGAYSQRLICLQRVKSVAMTCCVAIPLLDAT
jgi:hypothetical protein